MGAFWSLSVTYVTPVRISVVISGAGRRIVSSRSRLWSLSVTYVTPYRTTHRLIEIAALWGRDSIKYDYGDVVQILRMTAVTPLTVSANP